MAGAHVSLRISITCRIENENGLLDMRCRNRQQLHRTGARANSTLRRFHSYLPHSLPCDHTLGFAMIISRQRSVHLTTIVDDFDSGKISFAVPRFSKTSIFQASAIRLLDTKRTERKKGALRSSITFFFISRPVTHLNHRRLKMRLYYWQCSIYHHTEQIIQNIRLFQELWPSITNLL
jgi:hypothetical protein